MKNSVIKLLMLLSFAFVLVGTPVGDADNNPIRTLDIPDQH
ncbi:hypothetical protein [Bacillus sp. Bva_UNVM-123]